MNKKKVINNVVKAFGVSTTVLFGIALLASNITSLNRDAISNELEQPIFEILNKNPEAKYFTSKYSNIKDLMKDGRALVEKIAGEGSVLIENNEIKEGVKALPLAKDSKVTLVGYASAKPYYGGRGSSASKYQGENIDLVTALNNNQIKVNPKVDAYYQAFQGSLPYTFQDLDCPWNKVPELETDGFTGIGDDPELLKSIEEYGDAVIYNIARSAGEANDIKLTKGEDKLALSKYEKSILQALTQLKNEGKIKRVIVLLNSTNQIAQKEFEPYAIDATLWIGHPGCTGFNSVAKILNGDINPSGHLPDTFWYNHQDNPVIKNFGAIEYTNKAQVQEQFDIVENRRNAMGRYLAYQEGVYLGYRYAETRFVDTAINRAHNGNFEYDKTIYRPFGYGESYSEFELSNYHSSYNADEKTYTVNVDIKNTSDVPGRGVAQIYLNKAYTDVDIERHIEKPAVELVGFAKSKLLDKDEKQTLTVKVNEEDFASYDAEVAKTYVITEGDYRLTAASDAHEAAKNFLKDDGVNSVGGDAAFVSTYAKAYDETSFATSTAESSLSEDLGKHEHKKITNLFDEYNINKRADKGDNHIEFFSRNNWENMPEVKLKLTQGMIDQLNKQQGVDSIKPDNGKYPTYGAKNDLLLIDLIDDKDNVELWNKLLDQLSWQDTISLIQTGLRKTNMSGILGKPETKDHNGPTGITEAYGTGQGLARETNDPDSRKGAPKYPSVPVLAASFNEELATEFGNMLGEDALWAGYNGFYGIGINTHRSPYEGRHFEYFSEDPFLAGRLAANETKALQAKGCMAYIKHFALNDQETQRFGVAVWSNEQALREISLKPFEMAVVEGGAMNAMAAFSRIGLDFAPASKALQTDFLRGELGMKGIVVTDMYSLGYTHDQFPQFLMAGTDVPDGTVKTSVYQQFASGYSQVAWQMREAARRICYYTLSSNAMNGFDRDTTVIGIKAPWEKAVFAGTTTVYVLFGLSMAAVVATLIINNKSKFIKK